MEEKTKLIHIETIDTEKWIREVVREEFAKLQKEFADKIDEHNKRNAEKFKAESMSQIERDAMWERHAHLVEAYMDNMNKILEKKL